MTWIHDGFGMDTVTRLLVLGRVCSVHRSQPLRGPRPSPSQAPEHAPLRGRGQEAVGKQHASLGPLPAPSRQLPVAKQLLFLWRLQRLWLIGEAPLSSSVFFCRACLCSLHLKSKLGCSPQLPPPTAPQKPGDFWKYGLESLSFSPYHSDPGASKVTIKSLLSLGWRVPGQTMTTAKEPSASGKSVQQQDQVRLLGCMRVCVCV